LNCERSWSSFRWAQCDAGIVMDASAARAARIPMVECRAALDSGDASRAGTVETTAAA